MFTAAVGGSVAGGAEGPGEWGTADGAAMVDPPVGSATVAVDGELVSVAASRGERDSIWRGHKAIEAIMTTTTTVAAAPPRMRSRDRVGR
jgi:hypothetical protein